MKWDEGFELLVRSSKNHNCLLTFHISIAPCSLCIISYFSIVWVKFISSQMEFGRINGNFHVTDPRSSSSSNSKGNEKDVQPVDVKSEAFRLYRWVESLHGMYRSYKLGRQSGSLNDERVVLLIEHGFVFRND